jgi:dicarboxylate transporter 10
MSKSAAREEREKRAQQKRAGKNIKYPFWFGGSASCFAACATHPLDLGKAFAILYMI